MYKHIPPEEAAAEPLATDADPKPLLSPDSLAYMMYTSGSTGNPKGATVPHRAIIRLVKNNDFANFSPDEVFLLFAPISFDASTLEIWGPLLNGATLAIYPPNFESLDQLAEILAREKVTTLWLSSGLFNTVVDRNVDALKNLRQLLVGGDVVSPAHVRKTYAAHPHITIINGYGPTENTTFTCCFTIPRDWPADRPIPIGRPIRNTQVYILDENLQPMPVGVPGELYCGGDGLSHGYWNKPDLTSAAFVPHPFAAGSRLYKTGDRVRLLHDGNIEFLGRLDSQIKIRGFRIELGEIETAFRQLAGVEDAAAAIESNAADGKRLHAFLIAKPNQILDTTALHEDIRKALPEHACPSRIHIVEKFPLGPNGKVDKKALLSLPAVQAPAATTTPAGPLSATEQAIARVWREILDTHSVGLDESFFHLGGDSLRAIQAILQINRALNRNLTVSHIFESPTIRALAKKIDSLNTTAMPSIRKARIEPIRRRDVSKLSDAEVNTLLNQMLQKEK
jgi:amino acid adenylation domain-containing protein